MYIAGLAYLSRKPFFLEKHRLLLPPSQNNATGMPDALSHFKSWPTGHERLTHFMNSGIEMNQTNHNPEPNPKRTHHPDEIAYDVEVIDDVELVDGHSANREPIPEAIATMSPSGEDVAETKSFIERVLSPQSLQIMMAAGGGVLVIGIAIWLFSIGVFENPIISATAMAIGNLGLLGCGLWLCKSTRYTTAGRGLTLLSSLLLPLHLWFYHAQDLISLDDGGHLWIPALLISGLYAVIARVTRDSMFVYTLVGGIVLTGMLFLANPAIGSLWAILPTSGFLIVLGVICTHADRFFNEEQGAFSRNEFGKSFFNAGQATVMFGLTTIGIGQMLGMDSELYSTVGQAWTIGALALAAYNYAYSHTARPQGFAFPLMIVGIAFWAGLIAMNIFAIKITFNVLMLAVAIGLAGVNLWYHAAIARSKNKELSFADQQITKIAIPATAVALAIAGFTQIFGGLYYSANWFTDTLTWQLIVSGFAIWAAPGTWNWNETGKQSRPTAVLNMIGGSLALAMATMVFVFPNALGGMAAALVLPTILIGISIATNENKLAKRAAVGAACSTVLVALVSLALMEKSLIVFAGWPGIALMTVSAGYLAYISRAIRSLTVTLAAIAMGLVVAVQLIVMFDLTSAYTIIIGMSCLGIVLLAAVKIRESFTANNASVDDKSSASQAATEKRLAEQPSQPYIPLQTVANVLLLAGAVGAIFFVCSNLITSSIAIAHVGLLAFQAIPILAGWIGNKDESWKRTFITAGLATLITAAIALASVSTLTFLQRAELASLIVGAGMVIFGYFGWSMEKEDKADLVSFQLIMGSLLLAAPMIIGLGVYRVVGIETVNLAWRQLHEIGGLVIGLSLLGTGVLSKVRSTTLAGAAVMVTYVVSILFLVQWPAQLQSVSFLMMAGGGTFFTVAILLSFYRDRLLALPEQVRTGRGLFRVLKWR